MSLLLTLQAFIFAYLRIIHGGKTYIITFDFTGEGDVVNFHYAIISLHNVNQKP